MREKIFEFMWEREHDPVSARCRLFGKLSPEKKASTSGSESRVSPFTEGDYAIWREQNTWTHSFFVAFHYSWFVQDLARDAILQLP